MADPSEFSFGPPEDRDLDTCTDIFKKATGATTSREQLRQILRGPGALVLVAKRQGRIAGMISGLAFPGLIPPPRIEFTYVVDQESARRGLSGLLVDAFIREVRGQLPQARFVEINVAAANTSAMEFYSHHGFAVNGFVRGEQSSGDIVMMRKRFVVDRRPATPIS
jgi:GNAT superfamily N-acetyltransferase